MRNQLYEQALKKFGIPFTYEDSVPDEHINPTRGKQLQARLEPLDQELIAQYEQMYRDGSEPPPLLLWKHGRSKLVPLDGNQRIAAKEQVPVKLRKPFSAYIVETEDLAAVDRLCWQFNNLVNGRRLSYEESLQHAITFVRKYNHGVDTTAKDWGVKPWELAKCVRVLEIREMGAKAGIDSSRVGDGNVANLHPLGKIGDDAILKVLKIVADSGIGEKQISELVSDVTKARTSDTKMRLIDDFAKSAKVAAAAAATKGGRVIVRKGRMPREMLIKQLDQLKHLLHEFKEEAFKSTSKAERERYAGAALFIANKLIGIYGLGQYLKGQGVA